MGETTSDGSLVVHLPVAFNTCRHGLPVTQLCRQETVSGWLVWGHYACRTCDRVAIEYFTDPPDEALIAGRSLPILVRQHWPDTA